MPTDQSTETASASAPGATTTAPSPAEVTGLTGEEITILDHLSMAAALFFALPEHHLSDRSEFAHEIHVIQQRVMARAAIRWRPDYFTPMTGSAG